MYEDVTVEQLKAAILARLSTDLDQREGSFVDDMVGGVAWELAKVYQSLDRVLPIVYVDESSGEYIDKQAAWYGITRKAGTKATGMVEVTGKAGSRISAGAVFLTADGLEYLVEEETTLPESGTGLVPVTAAQVGGQYNAEAGEIVRQLASIPGVTAVTNPQALTGGADPEEDAALLARLNAHRQRPATSGNVHHYQQWALEVEGIGGAKVTPLWDGPGTVRVLIVGMDKQPVDTSIVEQCAAHIESQRPIGAAVTVASAQGLPVSVSAQITLTGTATLEQVVESYKAKLTAYLENISFAEYTVPVSRVAYLLLGLDGVGDYTGLTLNSSTDNLAVGPEQVPTLGEVRLWT